MIRFFIFAMLTYLTPLLAASAAEPTAPDVPDIIAVPPGHKLLFKLEAKGVQIYKAVAAKGGKLEWVLEAPLADLSDGKSKAGCHYLDEVSAVPAWEAVDGSKVKRDKAEDVIPSPAPNPKEDIAWLLIKVKAEEGKAGAFSSTVYIQRRETVGGKPPAEDPKRIGTKIGVAYKAVYYLYEKAEK
jgi:hypothetical protein